MALMPMGKQMMEMIIRCVISTAVAWRFALLFIRRKQMEAWFDACLCAAVHGLARLVLYRVVPDDGFFFAEVLCFLLMAVIVQLQGRDGYGNALIAFGLAQSAYAVLDVWSGLAYGGWRWPGWVAYLACLVLFLVITGLVKNRFPTENWREYYANAHPDPKRIPIRKWHVYAVVVAGGVLLTAMDWMMGGLRGSSFSMGGDLHASSFTMGGDLHVSSFVMAGITVFALFWYEISLLVLMHAYKRERIEMLLNRQYRDEMQSFMNVIRSQRHDYNFHVQTIAGLLREGNQEECLKYMDALEKDSAIMNTMLPIKDPAISAMIHNFHVLAVREGIALHIDIQDDLTRIATDVYETNKIVSNLLQNAIDETKTHADKSYGIHLTILKRGEYIVIRVSNEVDPLQMDLDKMNHIYQQGYSTKQGHDGVGLSSVKQLASRYRGTVYTQMEGTVVHFVAKIPINFAKERRAV